MLRLLLLLGIALAPADGGAGRLLGAGAPLPLGRGVTGAGVRVAVLDTGIDTDHPDLISDIAAQHCFCSGLLFGCCPNLGNEDVSAEDDQGHGTSVAGIITSAGVQAPLGVAPDAKIVAVKAGPDSEKRTEPCRSLVEIPWVNPEPASESSMFVAPQRTVS